MRDSFLEIKRIEPVPESPTGRYFATFEGRTPEGEFEVTVEFFAPSEEEIFNVARKTMRLMLARLAGVTSEWGASASTSRPASLAATEESGKTHSQS